MKGERIYFVTPYRGCQQRHPDLVQVSLPRDIGRFVLIDDTGGFDVMFRHRKRWCSLSGDVWAARWAHGEAPTWAPHISVVKFGRDVLRKMHVREMAWKDWQSPKTRAALTAAAERGNGNGNT